MALDIRPLHPVIGAEVSGLDLRQPLSAGDAAAIHAGMAIFLRTILSPPAKTILVESSSE